MQKLQSFIPRAISTLSLLVALSGGMQAASFTFVGNCQDCQGKGVATLVLQDSYVLGESIGYEDFVSFTYHGTDLFNPFTITASTLDNISGYLPAELPGYSYFFISQYTEMLPAYKSSANAIGPLMRFYFETVDDGEWNTGIGSGPKDFGTNGTWQSSQVPEPGALMLMGTGLIVLGLRRRKAKA